MIKVFLILASVVLLGSAVLGWMNRDEFIQTREEKDTTNKKTETKTTKTRAAIKALGAERKKIDEQHLAYDEAVLRREGFMDNIKSENNILAEKQGVIDTLLEEKAEQDRALEDLRVLYGPIVFSELPAKVEEMKTELADAEKTKEELGKQVVAMNNRVTRNEGTIGTLNEKQKERSQGIALNGTEGTITAVNQDWGFAVINIGKNQGVDGDSELIVKRGTEVVGMLSIVSIEPRLTVADIRLDTLKDGARILPGDKVIFEKLQN